MPKAFSLEMKDDGIAILYFDLPGEKVNKFNNAVMAEFEKQIDELASKSDIKCLLFMSKKPGIFIAGADVKEFNTVTDEETGYQVGLTGQRVFGKFENLLFPTAAVIDGACMGGGTEIALCADYRIATDNPKTKIAFPEVNLGILPGWGGTQRLPRLIGLQRSLPLILGGRPIDAKRGWKAGIVDKVIPAEWVMEMAMEFAKEVIAGKADKYTGRRTLKGPANAVLEKTPFGRKLIFSQAEKSVMQKTGGHYPAPLTALEVIRKTYGKSMRKGLELEARALGKLAVSPISKCLVNIYLWTEQIKKENGTDKPDLKGRPVAKAAVLGAGVMGGGIAQLFAAKQIPVRVKDINYDMVAKAYQQASSVLMGKVKKRRMRKLEYQQIMDRITGTTDYTGFGSTDLVIEAIVEDLGIKKTVLAELEKEVSKDTVIVTNTSSLLVDDMAKALKSKKRFVGMHFFNPVHRMPLVEVVRGKHTSDEAAATVFNLVKKLGKTPILVNDGPGFLVNRLLVPYMVEAIALLEEGNTIQRIDKALKNFGMPMGPIELFDEVGLDVAYKVAKILMESMGDRMAESDILKNLVEAGRLGKKNGKGFYKYMGRKKELDPAVDEFIELKKTMILDSPEIVNRMVYPMINEAARCLDEGIALRARDVDVGMIFGTGFAPFRGGLLSFADSEELDKVVSELERYAEMFGPRFTPSEALLKIKDGSGRFYE